MKFFFLHLIAFIFSLCLQAQDSSFYFTGKIYSAGTNIPVPNASVSIKGTSRSSLTNDKGEFSIRINKKKSILEVSAAFYKKVYLSVPFLIKPDAITFLEKEYAETVSKDSANVFSSFNSESIIDYESFYEKILVLTRKNNQEYCLFLLNENGQILCKKIIQRRACRLEKALTGTVFLITEESFCYLMLSDKAIRIINEKEISRTEKGGPSVILEDAANEYMVIPSIPDYILNEKLELKLRSRALSYFSFSKEKKFKALFKNLSDDRNQKLPAGEKTHLELNMNRLPFSNGPVNYKEIYAPLFKTKDGTSLFDLTSSKIENYDSIGRIMNSQPLFFHLNAGWTGKIYQDEATLKIYFINFFPAKDSSSAFSYAVYEINPADGSRKIVKKFYDKIICEVKILNGNIFYLSNNSSTILHKEKLDSF